MEASTSKKEFRFGSYIKCIFRDTFRSIKDNSLMSVASVLSIVAALIILGIFVIFSANLDQITNNMEAEMELKVLVKNMKEIVLIVGLIGKNLILTVLLIILV